ncbi:MAG: hypothetical protein Q8L78_02185 [Coxiellaceae bacterium]|nr:hypothetical protein [Coxiellaceae bacterium]
MSIHFYQTKVKNTQLGVVGSVEDVIAGVVRPDLKTRLLHAKDYQFGFELASPHRLESMGESVIANGMCYTTSTDKNDHYLQTISGETFYTSGIFLVPKTAESSYHFQPEKHEEGIAYYDFCEQIHAKAGGPCLAVALVHFKALEATHIQKAPIHNESIFDHKADYYGDLKLSLNDRYFFLVVAMANYGSDSASITEQLKVVLYHNPFDTSSALNIHTHGLVLNRRLVNPSELTPSDVTHTVHLYTEKSIIDEIIWGEVFVIGGIEQM